MREKTAFRVVIVFLVILAISFIFFTLRVKAQDDLILNLEERLVTQNVPLDSIVVRSRFPFVIDMRLRMINEAGNILTEDTWYLDLTHREASISHRYGINLDGYYISYVSESGKVFEGTYIGLFPDSKARQPFISDPNKLDNVKTKELLLETLNFGKMTIDKFEVTTGAGSRDDVQTINIELSVPDIQTGAEGIPKLVASIRSHLWTINENYDSTQIAICRVLVVDAAGKELFNYTNDLELGHVRWTSGDQAIENMFSGPLPEVAPSSTQKPVMYPTPSPTSDEEIPESPPFRTHTPTPTNEPYP
jgi:hypothetical protein